MQAQSGNWTLAITNLPTTENRSYTFVFVTNGTSPGYPNAMTVGGNGVTIRCQVVLLQHHHLVVLKTFYNYTHETWN